MNMTFFNWCKLIEILIIWLLSINVGSWYERSSWSALLLPVPKGHDNYDKFDYLKEKQQEQTTGPLNPTFPLFFP